jgi:hypothetical protein
MLLAILAASCCACAAQPFQTGISGSVSTSALNAVLAGVLPLLEKEVEGLAIPGTQGEADGFEYQLKAISCPTFTIASSSVTTAPATGLSIALSGMSLGCSADWSFKLHSWPHVPDGSGSVDISVTSTSATLGLNVTAVKLHAQVAPTDVAITVGDVGLTFHGSLFDWLLTLLKGYIEKAVSSGITAAFGTAITTVVENTVNPELLKMQMDLPLSVRAPYNFTEVRFGLTASPSVTATYLAVDLQGDVVNASAAGDPPLTPPALPPWTAASAASAVQLQLSAYTLESAIYAYYQADLLAWLVPAAQIPLGLNVTTAYSAIAPGLVAAFPHAAVSLALGFASMPNVSFTPEGVTIAAPITLGWVIAAANGSTPTAFTLLAATSLAGNLTIGVPAGANANDEAILGDVAYINSLLSVQSSSVGAVATAPLQALVDFVFGDIVVPEVNAIFAAGVPLPQLDGITLVNASILYAEGFLTIATNFSFDPNGDS